ncbi:Mercuric reductase MerA [alpha proteobacterium BAL199]|jgi:mercuric reductase|nr:Mercuric reductase MerA [alpha proteobacterium BAL199]
MSACCTPPSGADSFDLAVVGAGSAGFSAAITAADLGARVALIGHGTIGGTCVNIGCVPSKTLIRAVEAVRGARTASRFGGIAGNARIADWQEVIAGKDELVTSLRQRKYIDLLPEYPSVVYREGVARLTADSIDMPEGRIRAGRIIVATGASPAVPAIPGIETVDVLTSTTALDLTVLPATLLVLGGGYIGCELAQMFQRAGVAVTLVTRSRLLPDAEPEISDALTGYLRDEGVDVVTGLAYQRLRNDQGSAVLVIEKDGKSLELRAERLLVATGRTPNSAGMGLAAAGVALCPGGSVIVDQHLRSSRPDVYAAGDVTGRDPFVYMAAYGGKVAALNALGSEPQRYDSAAMPWVAFTDPQVAGVGMTEAAARAAGHRVKTSVLPLEHLPRALAARDTRGLIKLVADTDTDRLLGAQILAPEGADTIQTAVMAIKHGMTTKALGETIFPYLTTVEGLKLAAQGFGRDVTKLSCCAG